MSEQLRESIDGLKRKLRAEQATITPEMPKAVRRKLQNHIDSFGRFVSRDFVLSEAKRLQREIPGIHAIIFEDATKMLEELVAAGWQHVLLSTDSDIDRPATDDAITGGGCILIREPSGALGCILSVPPNYGGSDDFDLGILYHEFAHWKSVHEDLPFARPAAFDYVEAEVYCHTYAIEQLIRQRFYVALFAYWISAIKAEPSANDAYYAEIARQRIFNSELGDRCRRILWPIFESKAGRNQS